MSDVKKWDGASDESLVTIEANECPYREYELATKRFRRLFNEIADLNASLTATQEKLAAAEKAPVRDDAWALRLIERTQRGVRVNEMGGIVAVHFDDPASILAAFNTQEKP